MSYTPTTGEARKAYVRQEIRELDLRGKYDPNDDVRVAAEFDRWLAALIREAKAEALIGVAESFNHGVIYPARVEFSHNDVFKILRARAAEYREGSET